MIAPHELKNKVFNKAVRGYNCSEVDEYVEFLIDKYTEIYRQNCELENELRTTKVKYSELHHDEDTIRAVIIKAQKLGENIVNQAKTEAQKIIDATKEKCNEKIEEAEKKVIESQQEIAKIKAMSENFRNSLYEQYLEHIKTLKALNLSPTILEEGVTKEALNEDVDTQISNAKDRVSQIDSSEDL